MMVDSLQNLQLDYQRNDFAAVIASVTALAQTRALRQEELLFLAQSKAKTGDFHGAAMAFGALAQSDLENQQMFLRMSVAFFRKSGNLNNALTFARQLHQLEPRNEEAWLIYRHLLHGWLDMEELAASNQVLRDALERDDPLAFKVENPLDHIYWCDDERLNSKVSRIQKGTPFCGESRRERRSRPHVFGQPLRIGYLSNDFADCHATMHLLQGVLDWHNADAVDFTLFCYSPAPLVKADHGFRKRHVNRIVPIGNLTTSEAAEAIRARKIDILVDLKGHTKDAWIDLVNAGPAPIQVAYLGFPGSAHGIDCDYILTDKIVTPPQSQRYYHEKFCYLPESYQPNDWRYRALPKAATRASLGLPEDAFLFHSANLIKKITPETFAAWMEILRHSEGTLLYMLGGAPEANQNFHKSVAKAGIDPARIRFAGRVSVKDHFARMAAMDLGLDCLQCTGHTTSSEQLWMGLPVLTRKGNNFASRVSESLLSALDLPELIAKDSDHFVEKAIALTKQPENLKKIRQKLEQHKWVKPLFDSERMARHLEMAFQLMVARAKAGLPPEQIEVPPLLPRKTPFTTSPAQA